MSKGSKKPPRARGGFRQLPGAMAPEFFNLFEDELDVRSDDDLNVVRADNLDTRDACFLDLGLVDRIHRFDRHRDHRKSSLPSLNIDRRQRLEPSSFRLQESFPLRPRQPLRLTHGLALPS